MLIVQRKFTYRLFVALKGDIHPDIYINQDGVYFLNYNMLKYLAQFRLHSDLTQMIIYLNTTEV